MAFNGFWPMWRRKLLALFFIVQYHFRLSLLGLRFKARSIARTDIHAHAREYWHDLCQALATHALLNETLKNAKQKLENEHWQTVLHTAKKRLERFVFVEEMEIPTQKLDLSTLKTVWHTLETSKLPYDIPEKLKNTGQLVETKILPRIHTEKLKMLRHPEKTLNTLRHSQIALLMSGALALLLIGLFVLRGMIGQTLNTLKSADISTEPQFLISQLNPDSQHMTNSNASKSLVRLSQLDEDEYASQSEYNTWAYSACSAASLTTVLNAYGHHYRITDVLKVEASIGEITPQLGLMENAGIARTAAQFGFQTAWGTNWTLDEVKKNANAGHPVIVSWPPSRYDGGHIVVVTRGDTDNVYLADSSLWNRHVISDTQFMQWWTGFAAVVTPS